ncbi:DNA cytosine methyltransferase [Nocardia arizonensis]|uniref:DNA cytosine methyltransferase n=1 Tax=Nocardia arizonensis TaxID=1141647 RepID=UPI0006D11D49|nr:DNA cytosine methyltransferase [Nocardia arizonensis]
MTRIGSLFSGAGGLDLAALELFRGSSMAWHAEIDPGASRVLAYHWPDTPNLGSVSEIDWHSVEPVDVLCGGFPCQDVSAAGRRAGLADGTRSGLWSHMAAAIDVLRPRYVLIENVRGLLSAPAIRRVESAGADLGHVRGRPVLRALGAVLGDLADLGLDAEWTCVRASAVGACHRRERAFVLAYSPDASRGGWQGVDDGTGGETARRGRKRVAGRGARLDVGPVTLLPTPRTGDGVKGGPNQRGSSGDLMLPSAVARSGDRADELLLSGLAVAHAEGGLLPTPKTTDNHHSSPADLNRNDPGLRALPGLLPTPSASDSTGGGAHPDKRGGHMVQLINVAYAPERWGRYADAIARQEAVTRPAPEPTELSRTGNPRLAAPFAEWMMMWPDGWVTDPDIGLTRDEQLHIIGNGVVPAQAVAGFRYLLCIAAEAVGA